VRRAAAVIMTDRQFRRFHLFGRWWRPTGRATGDVAARLADRAGDGLRRRRVQRRRLSHGLIGAAAVAAHAVALQIAALTFMVPLGLGAGGDGPRRPRARPRRPRRDHPRRLDRLGMGVGFMALMALAHVGHSRAS
jgi:MATE family multidrug resistance protein